MLLDYVRMRHLRAITAQLLPRRFFSLSLARTFFLIAPRNYSLIKWRVQTALIDCRKLMQSARGSLTPSNIAGSIAVIIPLPVYNPSVSSLTGDLNSLDDKWQINYVIHLALVPSFGSALKR